MNALPGAYLTWATSVEPLTSFLRYLVYRRKTGDTAYTRVGRITDRSLTSFQDYTLASGVSYDYAVTQVSSASGEEVESAFPTAATASVTIRSTFIHDVAAPANYVEILAEGQSVSPEQDVAYLQVWGRNQPTAHVGKRLANVIEVAGTRSWLTDSAVWLAIETLQIRQRDNGATLCLRQNRIPRVYGQIASAGRDDSGVVRYGLKLRFSETYFDESVAS